MTSAFKLFSVRGIAIRMHITFPLILLWAAIQFGYLAEGGWIGALFGIIVVTLLFVIVTLHELGHSMAALHYDVPVKQIVLLPIGGVAELSNIPENPMQEFIIALAGPAVNFVIAIVLGLAIPLFDISVANPLNVLDNLQRITFTAVFYYVFLANMFLALFNLLPAFPLDGGRILRALLATRIPYERATSIAAVIGRGMALLLGLYGFLGGGFFTILIAFFIYMGAGQEASLVHTRTLLRGLTVEDAYSREVQTLQHEDTLHKAIQLTLSSLQASFPVCDGGQLLGMLTYRNLVESLNEQGPHTVVGDVMVRDVPTVTTGDELFNVQEQFQESQLDVLPVIENGRFLGLITSGDVNEVYRLLSIDPDLLAERTRRRRTAFEISGEAGL